MPLTVRKTSVRFIVSLLVI